MNTSGRPYVRYCRDVSTDEKMLLPLYSYITNIQLSWEELLEKEAGALLFRSLDRNVDTAMACAIYATWSIAANS